VHHAAIDGKAGVVLARAMLDLVANPAPIGKPSPRPTPRPPEAVALLKAALSRQARLSARLLKLLPDLARAGSRAASESFGERVQALLSAGRPRGGRDGLPLFAPRTPLNVSIDGARAIATTQVTLEQIRQVCAALGGTVNDAVLAICSGGLRRYLQSHDALPADPLIAAVPVSLRAEGDESQNTQTTMYRASIATHIDDARERYDAICAASRSMKSTIAGTRALIPLDFPSLGVPWLLPALSSLYARARVADRLSPVANLVISNVPGPQVPLYMSGAQMLTYHPLSIVTHGLALNVTVESYNASLYFGLVACRRALPDLGTLAGQMGEARDELLELAARETGETRETPETRETRPRRVAARKAPKKAPGTGAKTASKKPRKPAPG
jgi:diacylglycerol O-acyltransferase